MSPPGQPQLCDQSIGVVSQIRIRAAAEVLEGRRSAPWRVERCSGLGTHRCEPNRVWATVDRHGLPMMSGSRTFDFRQKSSLRITPPPTMVSSMRDRTLSAREHAEGRKYLRDNRASTRADPCRRLARRLARSGPSRTVIPTRSLTPGNRSTTRFHRPLTGLGPERTSGRTSSSTNPCDDPCRRR